MQAGSLWRRGARQTARRLPLPPPASDRALHPRLLLPSLRLAIEIDGGEHNTPRPRRATPSAAAYVAEQRVDDALLEP